MLSQLSIALFGALWLAFSVAGLIAMVRTGQTFGVIFSLLFIAAGVFMLARPLIEHRGAAATHLAITNKRFVMITRHGRTVRSVDLRSIRQVERVEKWGGVTLRIPTALISDGDGGQKVDYTDLHGLSDAERAYRLLTKPDT